MQKKKIKINEEVRLLKGPFEVLYLGMVWCLVPMRCSCCQGDGRQREQLITFTNNNNRKLQLQLEAGD